MKISRENLGVLTKKTYLSYVKMFPVLQKEKTKKYTMIIVTFTTMIFFAIFAINPTLTTIAGLHRTLDDARFVDSKLSEKIANLGTLQDLYEQLTPDLQAINNSIPESPEAAKLAGQMQTLLSDSGLTITGIGISDVILNESTETNTDSFTYSVQATGSLAQLQALLTNLTSMNRIVTIDTLSINRDSVDTTILSITLEGKAYFKK